SKEDRCGITAHKSPIGRAFHQLGMKKTPTYGSFTLLFEREVKAISNNNFNLKVNGFYYIL
ncbi:hypothetical protein V7024_12470, partial [Bacillus sp. JJ864]|uniref:hypothetical protein n=1 Tax=Bacillus sp. JJ864 TaxID=3122975 RepID=UPI002FFDCE6F